MMCRWLSLAVCLTLVSACSEDAGEVGSGGGTDTSTATASAASTAAAGPEEQRPSPCGETPNAPEFEIGTGEVCYEPLVEGQVVPHITGPQGGYHVWAAVLCPACPPKVSATVFATLAETGENVGEVTTRVIELKSGQAAGLLAYLLGSTADPASHLPEGTELLVHVELATLAGEPLYAGQRLEVLGPVEIWLNQCDPEPSTCGTPGGLKCCSD
ncbi:MAG: hypothetical protein HOV80_11225 [Polyangiaceae bacterium]|nr:hypothetical protein [Polyangiaceae bacterium]